MSCKLLILLGMSILCHGANKKPTLEPIRTMFEVRVGYGNILTDTIIAHVCRDGHFSMLFKFPNGKTDGGRSYLYDREENDGQNTELKSIDPEDLDLLQKAIIDFEEMHPRK